MENETKQMKLYYMIAFGVAWILQILIAVFFEKLGMAGAQVCLIGVMFIPAIAVLLSGYPLKEIGWKPVFRGKKKYYAVAWFLPAVLIPLGALLFFAVFPKAFDLSGASMEASAGAEALEQLEAQGLTYPMYLLVSAVQALLIAPLLNMIPSAGEEIGWRGVMTPYLKKKYGREKGLIIAGIIWGIWHWPLIILLGYEYGTGYFGAPFSGIILFCLITCGFSVLEDFVYERTGCIWAPAILHGSINAWATLPPAVCSPAYMKYSLLGPAPVGLIGALPLLICAYMILRKKGKLYGLR